MVAPAAQKKEQLRLFAKLGPARDEACGKGAAEPGAAAPPPAATRRWGLHALATTCHDFPTTSLLLSVLAGPSAAAPPRSFDRTDNSSGTDASSSSSSSSSSGSGDDQEGALAAALARQLLPGGWALLSLPLARWQVQLVVESPCGGVPGLCRFVAARAAWLRAQLRQAFEQDQCRQVVLLRAGYSTLSHELATPGVKFFEVDAREVVRRKKQALDALLPGWRRDACRPRFVEVDLLKGSHLELITWLTAEGFDPQRRCCLVAEGLLPYLGADAGKALLRDLAALAAPGSRLLFDALHADALEGAAAGLPGFASFAAAAANKDTPLCSGLAPAPSALVRFLQPSQFRLAALLPPAEVARCSLPPLKQPAAAGAAAASAAPAPAGLPYVPEFLFLVAAVKIDTRLLLRHVESPAGGDEGAGSVAGWAAAGATAALSSPSCFVRTLAQLLWGGGNSGSSSGSSTGSRLAALPAPAAPASPMQPPAGPLGGTPVPLRQQSAEWSLAAVGSGSAALLAAPSSSGGSSAATGGSSSAQAPASTLQHAESIAPMALLRSGCGSGAGSPTGRGSSGDDSGHLMAAAAALRAAEGGVGGAAAQHGTLYGSIASLMSSIF